MRSTAPPSTSSSRAVWMAAYVRASVVDSRLRETGTPSSALAASHNLLLSHGWAVPVLRRNSPGAEVGITLNFTPASGSGSFDFQSGSKIILGINTGGSGDLLNFDGLASGTLLFNGNLQVTAPAGYVPTSPQTFNLIDWLQVVVAIFFLGSLDPIPPSIYFPVKSIFTPGQLILSFSASFTAPETSGPTVKSECTMPWNARKSIVAPSPSLELSSTTLKRLPVCEPT